MLNAIATVHWPKGFWITRGGYEYNLIIWAAAIAVAFTGGGRFSVDRLLGWDDNLSGLWWGVGALLASALVSAATLTIGRELPERRPASIAADQGSNGGSGARPPAPVRGSANVGGTPVGIQVGSAHDGNDLVDTLSRHGLSANLVEGVGLWQVDLLSTLEAPPELLHELFHALESWAPTHGGSGFLVQVGERGDAR
jgi:hypothetical protein